MDLVWIDCSNLFNMEETWKKGRICDYGSCIDFLRRFLVKEMVATAMSTSDICMRILVMIRPGE